VSYQLRIFMQKALPMLYSSEIVEVEMECRDVHAVDDLKVKYQETGIMDHGTLVHVDYFQIKYHDSQAGPVSAESLMKPAFSGTKEPMLKRFWEAWQKLERELRPQERNFRLILKTNRPWDPWCPVAKHLDADFRLKREFFDAKSTTALGDIRCRWRDSCETSNEGDFNKFLTTLRFQVESPSLAGSEAHLRDICRLAGLDVLPASMDLNPYDALAQVFLLEGKTRHTAESLRKRLEQNKLIAAPLRLKRGTVNKEEPLRLLCFVEHVLGSAPPESFGRPQAKQFRVKFWLSEGKGLPDRLDEAGIEGVTGDQLAHAIAEVYSVQLNETPNGRLLLGLFLPQQDLVVDGLSAFLQRLRECAKACLPNCTGIPLLLACSSRWPVGSSAHPLSKTRAHLRRASSELIDTLFLDPSQGQSSMNSLNWLMIDGLQQAGKPRPQAFLDVVDGNELFRTKDDSIDSDDVIDPLANRNAVYLSEAAGRAQSQNDLNPIDPLLMRGIPLIWCEKSQTTSGGQEPAAEGQSCHPMDSILGWNGLTFLDKLHRFQHEEFSQADEGDRHIRQFIRSGILFWEDHRHIPASAPVNSFRDPFLPYRP